MRSSLPLKSASILFLYFRFHLIMAKNSFLRWAGSKQKLIPKLQQYWNGDFDRYIEPFMGSAELFFSIETTDAILSDTNTELVETFRQVKKNPYAIYHILKTFKNSKDNYYKIRAENPFKIS